MPTPPAQRAHHVVADVEPLDVDGVRSLVVGTLAWVGALIALLPFTATLRDQDRLWWLWTCAVGVVLGLLGIAYCRRRRRRLHQRERVVADRVEDGPG
jgi:H+/Cl- antiporter ClcA